MVRSGQQEGPPTQSTAPLTQMPCSLALMETPPGTCLVTLVLFQPHDSSLMSRKVMALGTTEVAHHVIHLMPSPGWASPFPAWDRVQKTPLHCTLKAMMLSSIVTGLDPAAPDFAL